MASPEESSPSQEISFNVGDLIKVTGHIYIAAWTTPDNSNNLAPLSLKTPRDLVVIRVPLEFDGQLECFDIQGQQKVFVGNTLLNVLARRALGSVEVIPASQE